VAELLASLHPLHAQAVRARFFQQLSFDEIAARQHCSVATARQRVRWGLLRLAELLGGGSGSDLAPETRREDGSSSDDDAGRDVP
jgi:DNA-directed RNA polymerase specialized sigma24 family protein